VTRISTRPGNPDAIVPYGYLLLVEEDGGVREEPISAAAMEAIEGQIQRLYRLHDVVGREIVRSGWTVTPEQGLGLVHNELGLMLGLSYFGEGMGDDEESIGELLGHAVRTDGDHHKQWFLEEVAKRLGIALPPHERGIAP
jgi:hypothetical protein